MNQTAAEPDVQTPDQDSKQGQGAIRRAGPLFDVSGLDPHAPPVIDRKGLEEWIPHRGHMLQIDGVLWHSPDYTKGVAIKHVRDDEFWVPGHIPGRPILPGVLMIEASAQLSCIMYFARINKGKFAGFTRIENSVFRGTVEPGDDLLLLSLEHKFHPRRFVADVQGMVKDKIVFESRVTGMIL